MTGQPFTLKQGERMERPGSVVVFSNGSRFSLNFEEDFAHLLDSFSARAATALAEIFPEPKAVLGLTEEEQFVAVPSASHVHEHFSRLVRDYRRAIQDLQTDEDNPHALEKRNYSAALIQGYCSLGYIAHKLEAIDLSDEADFTGVPLIALASQDAPYVTRAEWQTYERALVAAMIEEAKLSLEIRLRLDGDGPLPTERVRQRRPRRKTALNANLPWVGEFLPGPLKPTLHRSAALLDADVCYSEGKYALLVQRLLWHTQTTTDSFEDGEAALTRLRFPEGNEESLRFMLTTASGAFRTESHLSGSKRTAVLRPLATSLPDFQQLALQGLPDRLRAAMGN